MTLRDTFYVSLFRDINSSMYNFCTGLVSDSFLCASSSVNHSRHLDTRIAILNYSTQGKICYMGSLLLAKYPIL